MKVSCCLQTTLSTNVLIVVIFCSKHALAKHIKFTSMCKILLYLSPPPFPTLGRAWEWG